MQTVSTVGYGDSNPEIDQDYHDQLLLTFTMILGILSFSYLSGQLTTFMKDKEMTMGVREVLDEKEQ